MQIEYRWLKGDELEILEPVLESKGWMSLNHKTSVAISAFNGNELVGFLIFQAIPYCGPLYVDQEYRGNNLVLVMIGKMLEFFTEINCRGCLVSLENPSLESLCEKFGFQKMDNPVYVRNEPF